MGFIYTLGDETRKEEREKYQGRKQYDATVMHQFNWKEVFNIAPVEGQTYTKE